MSIEVIARLSVYPKMEALLDSLPPKLIALSAEQPAEPVAWDRAAHAGGRHVEHAVTCIQEAFFTGKGDKPKVQMLLAQLEWLIRGAVEEDAASSGLDGRTIDPAIIRRRRRARVQNELVDDSITTRLLVNELTAGR